MRRNRVDAAFIVLIECDANVVCDVIVRRRNSERHRKWDDDEGQGEEENRVANVTL
jgi:hypothetical protein